MQRCLIIAEAGVNHNGNLELAKELVRAAATAGADAIKFQTFAAERLVASGTATADYQQQQTGETDQLTMLRKLELSRSGFRDLCSLAGTLGIEFMSTPFDEESADFLRELGMRRFKISSGDLTNLPLLAHIAAFDSPMIVSTGMATIEEVAIAVRTIGRARKGPKTPGEFPSLTLLHCTSNYPAPLATVNLRAMQFLAHNFSLPAGYSDHTEGTTVALAAAAMGASVIEKHFTLDRNAPGPDHRASIEPAALSTMVRQIRDIECALGNGEKQPADSEAPIAEIARRSVAVARDLAAGHQLGMEDLVMLRPGTGIQPSMTESLLGKKLRVNVRARTLLRPDDLE